jgi:hypothetical protein
MIQALGLSTHKCQTRRRQSSVNKMKPGPLLYNCLWHLLLPFQTKLERLTLQSARLMSPPLEKNPVRGSVLIGSSLTSNYYARVEVNVIGKHSSLFQYSHNYNRKKFCSVDSWAIIFSYFTAELLKLVASYWTSSCLFCKILDFWLGFNFRFN